MDFYVRSLEKAQKKIGREGKLDFEDEEIVYNEPKPARDFPSFLVLPKPGEIGAMPLESKPTPSFLQLPKPWEIPAS